MPQRPLTPSLAHVAQAEGVVEQSFRSLVHAHDRWAETPTEETFQTYDERFGEYLDALDALSGVLRSTRMAVRQHNASMSVQR